MNSAALAQKPFPSPQVTVTHLLGRWSQGERSAAEQLMPRVYGELRRIARCYFRRERADHTLEPTALVHEVFLQLADQSGIAWQNRAHFYGLAACMMRRALIDYSRERACQKRGGKMEKIPLEDLRNLSFERPEAMLALDDALHDLARFDPQKALIVELRFFGGLSMDQVAECLALSPRSVARQWQRARVMLFRELSSEVG